MVRSRPGRGQRRRAGPALTPVALHAKRSCVKLVVNGAPRELPDGQTVAALLAALGVPRERVAVEVNGEVVRRASHEQHALADGDAVEVVSFVGGG